MSFLLNDSVCAGVSGTLNMSGGDRRSDFLIQNYQGDQFNNVFLYTQVTTHFSVETDDVIGVMTSLV